MRATTSKRKQNARAIVGLFAYGHLSLGQALIGGNFVIVVAQKSEYGSFLIRNDFASR